MTSAREVLQAARKKIEKPEAWTQWTLARNEAGRSVPARDPSAVCWCMEGAILAVGDRTDEIMQALRAATHSKEPGFWNDRPTRRHETVLAAFDRAIALAGDAP